MKNYWTLRLDKFLSFLLSWVFVSSFAQMNPMDSEGAKMVTENSRYLFPIEPGTPNRLAGTMGELRSNHFHSGIDIRTYSRIGLPVKAAQRGYVSRVSVSPSGYGNAIYVTHPNGQTTVYGHLSHFEKNIADYVRKEQYRRKTFAVNLYFKSGTFPVNRGDTIAFSGNSGGSSGPHLHFDIRDGNNEALNPLQFNFDEVIDNVPPLVQKVALRTMDINSRINDRFGRFEFYAVKNGEHYELPYPILANGIIGIEVLAHDRLNDNPSRCGINFIEMYAGEQLTFRQIIDKVNFGNTRNILALMDYNVLQQSGKRFNKLYIDDGNHLPYYNGTIGKGIISVSDVEVPVKVALRDTYGNQTLLNLTLKPSPPTREIMFMDAEVKKIAYEIIENTLVVNSKKELGDSLLLFFNKESTIIAPTYFTKKQNVFLLDLRKVLPDSLKVGHEVVKTQFKDRVPSGVDYTYYSDVVNLQFSKNTLYDTLFLHVDYQQGEIERFTLGDPSIPVNRAMKITLKPKIHYSEKSSIYLLSGNSYQYMGGAWANGQISFNSTEFGTFTILEDIQAPIIRPVAVNGGAARFKISDDRSGIAYYEATISGEWLLMNYDPKNNAIWAERLDAAKPLQGEFSLKVVDNAGNENIYKQTINRP